MNAATRSRARVLPGFVLAPIIALAALLLPFVAGVAEGHHAVVLVAQIDCNGQVNYEVDDWATSGTGALATFTVSYAVNGTSSWTTIGNAAFTAGHYTVTGSFSVGPSVTSVVVRATNFVWGDGVNAPGPWQSNSGKRPTTCKSPTIATTLSATSSSIGAAVHDSAALTGATASASGTVTYTVYTNSGCTAGAQAAGTVTVTNGIVPDSNPITFNSAGTWYWQAVYSGDANNSGATSACTEETLVVTATQTPFSSIGGATATPFHSPTPPPTGTDSGPVGSSSPLLALLICLSLAGIGLMAVGAQRQRR